MAENRNFNSRVLLAIAILAGFVLLVIAMLMSYVLAMNNMPSSPLISLLFQYHLELMVLVSILGIVVGASVYFLMSGQVQEKTKEAAVNAELLLTFLGHDERAIVGLLRTSDGHTTQSQVSRLEGMTRLRAHRTVAKLADKKIIRVEKLGKINQLWLAKSIYDALSEIKPAA